MFKIVALGVAVILISLTFLAVGCGAPDTTVTTTVSSPAQLPASAPLQAQVSGFGGPYPYQGGIQKIAEFQWYKEQLTPLSKPMDLSRGLLSLSIKANRAVNGTGVELQRYNYVITEGDGKIYVGVWTKTINWQTTPNTEWLKGNRAGTCTNYVPDPRAPEKTIQNRMIDFHSEDPVIGSSSSPCWLEASKDDKRVGILDAMTKHFLLVQEDRTVGDFNLAEAIDWTSKKVAYAGELFVLLSGSTCRVVINNGSGTYRPAAGDDPKKVNEPDTLRHLKAVAKHISETIPIYAVSDPKVEFEVIDNPLTLGCPID